MNVKIMNEPYFLEHGGPFLDSSVIGLTWVRCGCPTLWLCVHGEGLLCSNCKANGRGEEGTGYYPNQYTRVATVHLMQLIRALMIEPGHPAQEARGQGEMWTPSTP